MNPGWYVLMYHEIDWAEDSHLRGLGITCPPDLFRDQVEHLLAAGRIVSIDEGRHALVAGRLERPLFSLTFDDGYRGVYRHAFPVLRDLGLTATIAVCGRFFRHQEMFWRGKLCHLAHAGGLPLLAEKLGSLGYGPGASFKSFTFERFSPAVLDAIDACYEHVTTAQERDAALRLFANATDIREMADAGWTIANHTASHHPVGEDIGISEFPTQFQECEDELHAEFGRPADLWVLPFDRPQHRSRALLETFHQVAGGRTLVLWGERANGHDHLDDGVVFRLSTPRVSGRSLLGHLAQSARHHRRHGVRS